MQIGILQTGEPPEELQAMYGNYNDMFIQLLGPVDNQFKFQTYRVLDNQLPEYPSECDGWLITGSKFSAYGPESWIPALKVFIRHIVDAELPLVGICFGHQIIAEALGGRVEKSEKGWGLGYDTYQLTSGENPDGPPPLTLNIFHQDQIVDLPAGAEVFASSDFCQYAGLYIGHRVMTIQAHPEFKREFNRQLLRIRKEVIEPEELADQALKDLNNRDTRTDSERFAREIGRFFRSGNQTREKKPAR